MKRLLWVYLALLGTFLLQKGTAQQISTAKLDSLLELVSAKNLMMGSIAISKDNKIVYKKSFGYRYINGNKKIATDENTKYRIGSITKLFTSVMIFQLVQEHKIGLDTKLSLFFPRIKNANIITIADMMRHRSGIHSFTDDSLFMTYYTKPQPKNFITDIIADYPSDFTPDTQSVYSNSNYFLLGRIIEKLDKRDYAISLKRRITDRLHLTNTFVGGKINVLNDESFSYEFKNNDWVKLPETDMSVPGGAGAIVSTPIDLTLFLDGLFDKKIITEANLTMDTTLKGDFGMDIYRVPFYDRYSWGHGGDIDGFHADLFKFVKSDLTIAVCYNGVNYNSNDILIAILKCCFGRPFNLSEFDSNNNIIKVDTAVLRRYTGAYGSKNIPLKMNVFLKGNQLFAQATGQAAFPLSAISEKAFVFKKAGIEIEFDAVKGEFLLKQGGGTFLFTKD